MRQAEGRGRTLEEAVDAALIVLGESRRNVDVKVLAEGPTETVVEVVVIEAEPLDNIDAGAQDAQAAPAEAGARFAPPRADEAARPFAGSAPTATLDPVAQGGRDAVARMLELMGLEATVTVRQPGDPVILDVSGRDLGLLIGWRGESLRALQTVTNMITGRQLGERRLIVDVERYRQRREHTVQEIALRAARQVRTTGEPITLDPMQPFERRSIHLVLDSDLEVTTTSVGEEPNRRVVVELRRPSA